MAQEIIAIGIVILALAYSVFLAIKPLLQVKGKTKSCGTDGGCGCNH